MFLKRKTISKPEKSSLSYTNQGKTTILPRPNNGIQLVYSIVCNFNGIVLFNFSNICVNFTVDYLKECLTHFQRVSHTLSSEIFGTCISVPGPGREPKKNLYEAIIANKMSTLIEVFFDIPKR